MPGRRRAVPPRPGRAGLGLAAGRRKRLYSRMMEVFAGFLSHTDHHFGRLLDFLREIGELDNTHDHGDLRQRRQRRGRPDRHDQRGAVLQQRPGTARGQPRRSSTRSAARSTSTTTRGAGPGPATRRSAAGSARPTAAAHRPVHRLAGRQGIKARGEVRTQYAHIIDMVPTVLDLLGIEPPATIRGVTQSPIHGVSFAHTFDDAGRRRAATTPSTSRCSATARSTTTAGGRCARGPGPSFTEAGVGFGSPISADKLSELDATGWELYHVDEDFAENHNVAAEHRDRLIALIGTWYVEAGKYGVLPIDGSGLARHGRREAAGRRAARPVRLPPGHPVRPVLRRAHGCSTGRTASPPTSRSPTAAPKACCSARAPRPAATRCTSRTASCTTCTTTSAAACYRCHSRRRCPPGAHELRFEFEPTGAPDLANGKGAPGRLQLYVDGDLVGDAEAPVTTPFVLNPGALTCGANPGSPSPPTTRARSVHRHPAHVVIDVSGELITDSESEVRIAMSRQ